MQTEHDTTEKQRAILEAARKRFAYYGYSKVTMDEIAADVALAKGSLYYYFPTKDGLFTSVLAHERDIYLSEMRSMLEKTESASDQLRMYAKRRFQLFRALVNLSTTGKADSESAPLIGQFFHDLEKEEMKLILHILQNGKRRGEFSITNVSQTAEAILHVLLGLRLRAIKNVRPSQLTDAMYHTIQQEGIFVVDLLLQGIRKKTNN